METAKPRDRDARWMPGCQDARTLNTTRITCSDKRYETIRDNPSPNPRIDVRSTDSRLLRLLDCASSHPSPPIVVVVAPVDDLDKDRSFRAMSVIADHVVSGVSSPPLQTRQTTTITPEATSRRAVVVTRAYEPHPAMINPLAFGHPQLQRTLYSQSPPNLQCDALSSESNNPGHRNHPQCTLDKLQDQPG